MKEMICILVIASRSKIYDKFINNYWAEMIRFIKNNNINIKVYLLFGNNVDTSDLKLNEEDILILDTPECMIPGILIKTIKAFEYINNNYKYKHIFRTNLSSFFIIDNLIEISKKLDDTNIYSGVLGIYDNLEFVSGAGFWLSNDNVNYLIKNQTKLNYKCIDDVAISKIFNKHKKTRLPRHDLTNDVDFVNKEELLNSIKKNNYHIRIKNLKHRNLDVNYMNAFTKIIYI
jgi:hypothetical protein